jgi:hypothetical protein
MLVPILSPTHLKLKTYPQATIYPNAVYRVGILSIIHTNCIPATPAAGKNNTVSHPK